jgi:hypothetical protein
MSRNMRAAAARPANMRRLGGTHSTAAVSAATVPTAAVSAATVPTAAVSAATVPTAAVSAAAAGICFECEKRHDEEQHRGNASAGRQNRTHGTAGLGTPHRRGWLTVGIPPRTKSF